MDAVPGFSQVKSLFQWLSGNSRGAIETQINFVKRCPVLSQGVSVGQYISGNATGAKETQIIFVKGLSSMADSVPIVGHLKAGVHHCLGHEECARNAANAANHTLGVIVGGAVGFSLGGPWGAAVGGAAGGALTDVTTSIQMNRPYGHIDNLVRIRDNPSDVGNYVDLAGTMILDAAIGRTVGEQITIGRTVGEQINTELRKRKLPDTDILDPGESMNKFSVNKKMKSNSTRVITEAKDQIPIPNMELQTNVPDVSITTCHDSQAIINISLSENSSAMGGLISVAVGTGAVVGAAIGFDDLRRNGIATEEPQGMSD